MLSLLAAAGEGWARARTGLALEVRTAEGTVRRSHAALDARPLGAKGAPAVARWDGLWDAGAGGERRVSVRSDGAVRVFLDGREVLWRRADARNARTEATVQVAPGHRPLAVELEAPAGDLRIRISGEDGVLRDVPRSSLATEPPSGTRRALIRFAGLLPVPAGLAWLAAALAGLALLARAPPARATRAATACACLLFALGLALRFEALLDRYWTTGRPAWAEALRPALAVLHPEALRWEPPAEPYEGDPFAYLRHARAMRHFYEARFREPFFVAAAKAGVFVAGGRDLGISLASMAFSALTVLAVYALGRVAFSEVAGLVAAAALAIDRWMIQLSVEGWRDDTFAFWVVVTALLALKVHDTGGARWAAALGAALAAATLTRITAFTLAVPLLFVLAFVPRAHPRGLRARPVLVGGAVFLLLVAPFLVSCWVVFGDPFHSINAVAPAYYVTADAPPTEASVGHYLRTRLRPFEMLDSVLVGYTAYPFAGKWRFDEWWPPLGRILAVLSVGGALIALTVPRGRLLWLVWAAALFPFVFTWQVPGGDAPRLTTFAYPFYLVAAGTAVWALLRLVVSPPARARAGARLRAAATRRSGFVAAGALAGLWFALQGVYYLRTREALRSGRAATIAAGLRDGLLFGPGWSRPTRRGNVTVRRTGPPGGRLEVPLRGETGHEVLVRMDPAAPAGEPGPGVRVVMNGTLLGSVALAFDPERIGTYTFVAPPAVVRGGANVLEIQPGAPVVVWYVRFTPVAP